MTATLASALVAAQKDMPAVDADAVNPHFNSRFVSLDHLIAKTKPVLTKHGLAIVQLPSNVGGLPALATTILHAASGETMTDTLVLVLEAQNMQKLGGALTYARRYAWAAALGICDEVDDDGNAASAPVPGATKVSSPGEVEKPSGGASPSPETPTFTAPQTTQAPNAPTEKQMDYLIKLMDQNKVTVADIGKPTGLLTKQEASKLIEDLKNGTFNPADLAAAGAGFVDDDIPFGPTIDGLGN